MPGRGAPADPGPPADARLLIVDDDVATIRLIHAIVSQDVKDVCFATRGHEALQLAVERRPDVILLDAELGDLDGYTVCRELKSNPITADIPVIFVTGHEDLQHEIRALDAGAADFITKPPSPARLRARIATQLRLKQLTDQLKAAAMVDALTGVGSRRAFDARLAAECHRALRGRHPLGLLMIDVDHFKRFNDCYGHIGGDRMLRTIAATLQRGIRSPPDMVARYGGEEFVVLLPETPEPAAAALGERMRRAIEELAIVHANSGGIGHVSISVGVAALVAFDDPSVRPDASALAADLVLRADAALYRAKKQGRNQVVIHSTCAPGDSPRASPR